MDNAVESVWYSTDPNFIPPVTGPENFATTGGKWGTSGVLGTSGGTVTWSIVGAGLTNQTGSTFFTGSTVALSSFLPADYLSQITAAFDAWHTAANINFVQVPDGGGDFGVGATADIRIGGGFIDGFNANGSVLGSAFFPPVGGNSNATATSGDIIFDSGDRWTDSLLYATALHEIGHTLGLDHVPQNNPIAVMNPVLHEGLPLQPDDIAGIRAIYGLPSLFLVGGAGNDFLSGGDANEVLIGGGGNDIATGRAGDDLLYGGPGDDNLLGDAGNDILIGEEGNDILQADAGNDFLYGGIGNDQPYGGTGDDVIIAGEGNDILVMEDGNDTGLGENGNDYIYAGAGNDVLYGGAGYDVLLGEVGNDFLFGGGSNIALGEADYLFGGAGADVFVIQQLAGSNVIQDFNRVEGDKISFQGTDIQSFAAVLSHTSDFGNYCIVTLSPSENVWIIVQTTATLQPGDFLFS
jgi:Ca2+-binding RTX toxin-like protein